VSGGRGSVFEYEHEHEYEHEELLGGLAVARAFQPEICPLRLGCLEIAARSLRVLQVYGVRCTVGRQEPRP